MNKGLLLYIAIDRNPDNGCEIQDACDRRSKVMIALKLVKGVREEAGAAWVNNKKDAAVENVFRTSACKSLVHIG